MSPGLCNPAGKNVLGFDAPSRSSLDHLLGGIGRAAAASESCSDRATVGGAAQLDGGEEHLAATGSGFMVIRPGSKLAGQTSPE